MAIHGTRGSWLKYGLMCKKNSSFEALFLDTRAGARILVREFSTVAPRTRRSNYPCPKETTANTISGFEMPYAIRRPVPSQRGRQLL